MDSAGPRVSTALNAEPPERRAPSRWTRQAFVWFVTPCLVAAIGYALLDRAGVVQSDLDILGVGTQLFALAAGGAALVPFRSARTVAWTLSGGAMAWALLTLISGVHATFDPTYELRWRQPSDDWWWNALWAFALFLMLMASMTPLLIAFVFPDGLFARPWARRSSKIVLTAFVVAGLQLSIVDAFGLSAWIPYDAWSIFVVAIGATAGVSLIILTIRFVRSDTVVRQQIAVFAAVEGAVCVVLIWTSSSGTEHSDEIVSVFFVAWTIGILAAIGVGVFGFGLYEIRQLIGRVARFTATRVLVTMAFVALYVLAATTIAQVIDSRLDTLGRTLTVVLLMLAVEPLRRRLISRLESDQLGERGRPLDALERLSIVVDSAVGSSAYRAVLGAVGDAVRAPGARLELRDSSTWREVASRGSSLDSALELPITHRQELLGRFLIATRTPGEPYEAVDRRLLDRMVELTAVRLYSIRRESESAEFRRTAMTAAARERERIGRDLHDGVAPLLAGAGLTAEGLRRHLPAQSPGEQAAARLAVRLRHAAEEVRSVAHSLQLDALQGGLVSALELTLRTGPESGPTLTIDVGARDLTGALAETAYLVVIEAVSNARRHAAASRVEVRVQQTSREFVVEVADDGGGMPQPWVGGLGLTSMRRRVESIGGELRVSSTRNTGTSIVARLPGASS